MRMDNSIMMQHLSINWCGLSDESDKVAKVRVADVDHGSDRQDKRLDVTVSGSNLCRCELFLHYCIFFYKVRTMCISTM